MNTTGIFIGLFTVLAIGLGFVWVIKLEYYVGAQDQLPLRHETHPYHRLSGSAVPVSFPANGRPGFGRAGHCRGNNLVGRSRVVPAGGEGAERASPG